MMVTIQQWRPSHLLQEAVRYAFSHKHKHQHEAFELFDAGLIPFEGLDGHLLRDIGIGPNGYHAHVADQPTGTDKTGPVHAQ
jgi:hypothetical protein